MTTLINQDILDDLQKQAQDNPRLRMNMDLRTSPEDQSQRMLNALQPGTVLPIHRHRQSTEVVVVLCGCMDEIFYDENGHETARYHLDPTKGAYALNIPKGQWHSIEVFTPTVIFEAKDGAYTPQTSEDVLTLES